MGIEDEIHIIQQQLDKIIDVIHTVHKEKDNVSDKKDNNAKNTEPKQETDHDEPILYECTNCGVNFTRGEEHV